MSRARQTIATKFAKESNTDVNSGYPDFDRYVVPLKEINDIKEEKRLVETTAAVNDLTQFQEKQEQLFDKVTQLDDDITEMSQQANLPSSSGPVTADLDKVLQKNKIIMQAYHGQSFVGNHCHKYLKLIKEGVYNDICDSVIRNTVLLTDDPRIQPKQMRSVKHLNH